jgi:integrase|tara:strand:+ start:233 stop:1414 length:1182 start_codon:yes stop_codon:yes gene_type:complete
MPKQTRRKTRHTGVFIVDLSSGDQTFYIRYKREGKLIEERAGRKKQGMTSAKANKIRAERISGKTESNVEKRKRNQTQVRRLDLDDLWEEYLKIKRDQVKAVSTDLSRYKNHISEIFGKKFPDEIYPLDIDWFTSEMSKTRSPKTVSNILELLRRIINFGISKQLCPPISLKIRFPSVDNQRIEVLTDEQFSNLNEVWEEYPDQHIVNMHKLIAWTGMRPSESCRLKWEDIDLELGVLSKINTKSGKTVQLRLSKTVKQILESQKTLLQKEAPGMADSEFVFPRKDGKKREPNSWLKNVREICNSAEIPGTFRPNYCLRDTIATTMLSNGASVDEVGYQLGHEPGSPMMKRYARYMTEAQQRIVDHSEALLKKKLKGNSPSHHNEPVIPDTQR